MSELFPLLVINGLNPLLNSANFGLVKGPAGCLNSGLRNVRSPQRGEGVEGGGEKSYFLLCEYLA
jgi:hypothetical protein